MKISSCDRCGACCSVFVVEITPFDILRIVEGTGRKPSEFVAALQPPKEGIKGPTVLIGGEMLKLALRWSTGRTCVFFSEDGGCTVHASRPMACRAYPLERRNGKFVNAKVLVCAEKWFPRDMGPWVKDFDRSKLEVKGYTKIAKEWNSRGGGSLNEFLAFAMGKAKEGRAR